MSFDDLLADCNSAFTEAFAETAMVIYRPFEGTPRQIKAIIDRNPPEQIEVAGSRVGNQPLYRSPGSTYSMMISVDNDPVTGIDMTTFNPGKDKIDIPLVLNGNAVTRSFSEDKAAHDGGRVSLKVR